MKKHRFFKISIIIFTTLILLMLFTFFINPINCTHYNCKNCAVIQHLRYLILWFITGLYIIYLFSYLTYVTIKK